MTTDAEPSGHPARPSEDLGPERAVVDTGLGGAQLDRIWAGWRSSYVGSAVTKSADDHGGAATRSVFSRLLAAVESGSMTDREALIVRRCEHAFVVLNAYPYGSGHLLVLPIREVATLDELSEPEAADVWSLIRQASRAVNAAYRPQGVNIGFNIGAAAGAGVPSHLHAHVLPRWNADTNFMTSIAETRVLVEPLDETYTKLNAVWTGSAGQ